jgi:hypothetical protein
MQKHLKTYFKIMAPIQQSEDDKFDNANTDLSLVDVSLDNPGNRSLPKGKGQTENTSTMKDLIAMGTALHLGDQKPYCRHSRDRTWYSQKAWRSRNIAIKLIRVVM